METRKSVVLLLFVMFICKISADRLTNEALQKLPEYTCTYDSEKQPKKGGNNCKVEKKDGFRWAEDSKLPMQKPVNCELELKADHGCNVNGIVKFAVRASFTENVTGFRIDHLSLHTTKYEVTLPKNYNQSIGGRFVINMTSFDQYYIGATSRHSVKIFSLPKSSACNTGSMYMGCLNHDEHKRKKCSEEIDICSSSVAATPAPVTSNTTSTIPMPETASNKKILVGILVSSILLIIIVGVLIVLKRRQKKKKTRKRAVILASSGDSSSKFTDMANLIASELKSSDEYEEVFFTGWLQVNNLGTNLEKLVDALHRSTVVILFASPFGKTSYENFLQQGQLATWKDEFVIGAHSLFRASNHTLINSKLTSVKKRKILVVYHSDESLKKSDFIHDDFERHSHRCYDLAQENSVLYKQLLHRRSTRIVYNGETCSEDDSTTKFI